jgi:hypothetical protein
VTGVDLLNYVNNLVAKNLVKVVELNVDVGDSNRESYPDKEVIRV